MSGRRWPVDRIGAPLRETWLGETASLTALELRGIGRLLVFEAPVGAYTLRRVAFVLRRGELERAADILTCSESATDDADGDGIAELTECQREFVLDDNGELLDNWAVRTTYHAWNGTCFVPRYEQFQSCGELGPLVRIAR